MDTQIHEIEKAILCAADHIEKEPERWCRGHYTIISPLGNAHCAIGWIGECLEVEYDVENEVREFLHEKGSKLTEASIIAFNDDDKNDHLDVAKFLRELVAK